MEKGYNLTNDDLEAMEESPEPELVNSTLVGVQNPSSFYWVAFYTNGQAVPQFDPHTGLENRFVNIDLTQIKSIALMPFTKELAMKVQLHTSTRVSSMLRPHTIFFHGDERPIYFKKQSIAYSPAPDGTPTNLRPHRTVYVLGWQRTVKGVNIKSFLFLYDDGSAKVSSHPKGYAHGPFAHQLDKGGHFGVKT